MTRGGNGSKPDEPINGKPKDPPPVPLKPIKPPPPKTPG